MMQRAELNIQTENHLNIFDESSSDLDIQDDENQAIAQDDILTSNFTSPINQAFEVLVPASLALTSGILFGSGIGAGIGALGGNATYAAYGALGATLTTGTLLVEIGTAAVIYKGLTYIGCIRERYDCLDNPCTGFLTKAAVGITGFFTSVTTAKLVGQPYEIACASGGLFGGYSGLLLALATGSSTSVSPYLKFNLFNRNKPSDNRIENEISEQRLYSPVRI